MRTLIILPLIVLMTGCLAKPASYYNAQKDVGVKVGELLIKAAETPLVEWKGPWKCGESTSVAIPEKPVTQTCSVKVANPNMAQIAALIPKIEAGVGGAEVAIEVIRALGGVAKYGIIGGVAKTALKEIGEKNYNLNNSGDGSIDFKQDYHDTDIQQMENVTTQTTTTTETSTEGSHNTDRHDIAGSYNTDSNDVTDSHDIADSYNPETSTATSTTDSHAIDSNDANTTGSSNQYGL